MSNVLMETHSMVFLTIGNLVSPPSFPLPGQVEGRTGPPPLNERSLRSWLLGKTGPSSRGICCLARGTRETRCLLISSASNRRVTNALGDRFVAQLFFCSNPVLDIFSVFAAALTIQF